MNSRNKGANGERELASLIYDELGVQLVRNLEQSRNGGFDLIVSPGQIGPVAIHLARYAIECKRHSRSTHSLITSWWKQAERQADDTGLIPLLAYRENRQPWRVVVQLADIRPDLPRDWRGVEWTAELSLPAFAAMVREGNPR